MSGIGRKLLRASLPILALSLGVGVLVAFVLTRPKPAKKPREERGALVEVEAVKQVRQRLRVVEFGTVIPAEQVVMQPEVSGRIVWQHEELVPGGRFKKGEVLVRIDGRDYRLALRQSGASVDKAELDVRLEKARKEVAKAEWEVVDPKQTATDEGRTLALREPQLQAAQAGLAAAKSMRDQAKLAVSKTTLAAPFNGFVQSESVDVGQLVTPQMPLATLVGSDRFWVRVSVPVDRLAVIDVPGMNVGEGQGAPAVIVQEVAGERIERRGRVVRALGDLDPVGRLARLLVEIDDPLGLRDAPGAKAAKGAKTSPATGPEPKPATRHALPLLLGAFVEVAIEARELGDVVELPRLALRDGNSAYVFGPDGRLVVRDVKVAWRNEKNVLIREGLVPGDEVIVSRLPSAIPGMLLRRAPKLDKPAELGQR